MNKLYIIAGEDSGDLHAANLIRALSVRQEGLAVRGVGGDKMATVGTELVAHVKDINFMGFLEVVKNLGTIRKLFKKVKDDIEAWKPDAVVLIDYPGFNLRMAKFIHGLGIKVYYYISPQVWAWKKGRVKKIKAFTDKMLVILPFEKEFYKEEGLEVEFVGHPLLDVIQKQADKPLDKTGKKRIALLPGSRKQEIKRMLPLMLELPALFQEYEFVIAGAPSQSAAFYQHIIEDARVELRMNETYDILKEADMAVVTSGTATLETALFGVPQVVCYKGGWLSFMIGRALVNVKYISLVNLIMDRPTVKELIQQSFTMEHLVGEITSLLSAGPKRDKMLTDYAELWRRLGEAGASERAAQAILTHYTSS